MSRLDLYRFDPDTQLYSCQLCFKAIVRRPKGARIAHGKMHVRRGEAYSLWNRYQGDVYYQGTNPDPRVTMEGS